MTSWKRWIRASCPAQRAWGKKRGFCPRLRHLRRRGTSLCLSAGSRVSTAGSGWPADRGALVGLAALHGSALYSEP